ncbi:E3 ubiquitin- ligase TRIM71-like [Paramuricea clavata]|uniref:E3 ubiquitin- ligase TRIM71-like n=1 Tax=Paramuricea clavata TaxID=317549 RepID=A0A7D9JA44_PARCT|nr:E3 ubiquitin- ligase TRIM71-like [Paramuricea clavata]
MVKVAAVLDRGIVPCSHNCSQSYSVARCVTCEKFLCRECLTDHNKYRGHNDHSVLTMEELSKPENRKKINDKMYCNEHSGKKLKVYCKTCDQLICKDCMDFKHVKQSHSCVLVKDVASNYKELLASNNKAMENALTEGNAFLGRITLKTERLDRDAENIKTEIAQRKEFVKKKVVHSVVDMLDQKAETLLKKVDEIHKGKRANLDRQAEETKLYVENIKTSFQLSKKLVDQGSEEEIISSQKMMLNNANNLLIKREEYFKAPIPVAKLSYISSTGKQPINENVLKELANSLGEVNDDEHAGMVMGTRSFDEKKTVKVSGVSQLLRDQIEKEFQAKGNSTGYSDDVNKLYVCPNGKDYVLVELEKDIPVGWKVIGDTLKIGGTALNVEQYKPPIASIEDFSSESVTKIWVPDEQIFPHNDDTGAYSMDRKLDRDKTRKKSHGRGTRQILINQRRLGLNSDQTPMPEDTFGETKVKLNKDLAKKIGKEAKLQEILNEENVKLHDDKLKGTWNGIFAVGKKLLLNCLTNASHYGAKSISIPAISSVIFGVPVSICAEILFMAATAFAKNAPKSNSLKAIRFVNIDKPTSQVFAQEMKKRFDASIHRENVKLFHCINVGGNEKGNQNEQNQFDDWKENPVATTQPTKPVDPKPAKDTFAGSRNS